MRATEENPHRACFSVSQNLFPSLLPRHDTTRRTALSCFASLHQTTLHCTTLYRTTQHSTSCLYLLEFTSCLSVYLTLPCGCGTRKIFVALLCTTLHLPPLRSTAKQNISRLSQLSPATVSVTVKNHEHNHNHDHSHNHNHNNNQDGRLEQ